MWLPAELKVKLLETRTFLEKHKLPCEPDVIFEFEDIMRKGNKRQKIKYKYVVEIETNATKQSIRKKTAQYIDSTAGITDLIILDLKELEKHEYCWCDYRINNHVKGTEYLPGMIEFIKERMPI